MLEIEPSKRPFEGSDGRLRIDLSGTTTGDMPSVIEVLSDEDCRAILAAADSPMTAKELIETCDIPRATVYRKLNRLEEVSLMRSTHRLEDGGLHPTQYQRNVDRLLLQPGDRRED
jgi:DNA-binding transcriptional ArsR family regulator